MHLVGIPATLTSFFYHQQILPLYHTFNEDVEEDWTKYRHWGIEPFRLQSNFISLIMRSGTQPLGQISIHLPVGFPNHCLTVSTNAKLIKKLFRYRFSQTHISKILMLKYWKSILRNLNLKKFLVTFCDIGTLGKQSCNWARHRTFWFSRLKCLQGVRPYKIVPLKPSHTHEAVSSKGPWKYSVN